MSRPKSDVFLISEFPMYCYVDRLWFKSYPLLFRWIRHDMRQYIELKREGVFEKLSMRAWTLYRTLNCIKLKLNRNIPYDEITPDSCIDVVGEKPIFDFTYCKKAGKGAPWQTCVMPNAFFVHDVDNFSIDSIRSLRLIQYSDEHGIEKAIYLEKSRWLSMQVFPFMRMFRPHLIRGFVNAILYAKDVWGLGTSPGSGSSPECSEYEFATENWFDVRCVDPERIRDVQRRLFSGLESLALYLWQVWFGAHSDIGKIVTRVTHVEFSLDTYVDKPRLVWSAKNISGVSKTIKSGVSNYVTFGDDPGLKYYITMKKNLQLKIYSKSYNKVLGKMLTRVEITKNVNKYTSELGDLFDEINDDRVKVIMLKIASRVQGSDVVYDYMKKLIPDHGVDDARYYNFLFDLLVNGSVKYSRQYRDVVGYYESIGLVKKEGYGANTMCVLSPAFFDLRKEFRNLLNLTFELVELRKDEAL